MNGYSSHTFKGYNDKSEYFWANYQIETEQGILNFTRQEAAPMKSDDPDYGGRVAQGPDLDLKEVENLAAMSSKDRAKATAKGS
jgi:hypothetical protein